MIAGFGELLLRLGSAPGERLLQRPQLEVFAGGAEANVLAALAQWGQATLMLSVLPQGPLGDFAAAELRRAGIDDRRLQRGPGRMGLYFYEPGAQRRPSQVHYDREHSAFALAEPEQFDWPELLEGASRLHLSGITPALGPALSAAALQAAQAARARGLRVSFDGNYRVSLWGRSGREPAAALRGLMHEADVLFANERDIALVLGREFEAGSPRQRFEAAATAAMAAFPHLQLIAATVREGDSVEQQRLGALLMHRDGELLELPAQMLDAVVDRIGTGDAFAAGLLHGLHSGWPRARCLRFALAAGAFKHSVKGDQLCASAAEIDAWAEGNSSDVRR